MQEKKAPVELTEDEIAACINDIRFGSRDSLAEAVQDLLDHQLAVNIRFMNWVVRSLVIGFILGGTYALVTLFYAR